MALTPLGGASPSALFGAGTSPQVSFGTVVKAHVEPPRAAASASAVTAPPVAPKPATGDFAPSHMIHQVQSAQARMENIMKLAESGKTFSAAELLSLQTHVYRASQELDLAGKVVEKATGGVKQVLQTQV